MNKKHGFTLIELLTVVLILGILTAIALPQYRKSIQRAEAANMLIALKTVFDSAKRYYATSDTWPSSLTGLDTVVPLNQGTTDESGDYKYSFNTSYRTVSVCKMNATGACAYYLDAYYKSGDTRDVYTCRPAVGQAKYKPLCDSFGTKTNTRGDIIIE